VFALRDELLELACDVPLLRTHADGDLARHRLDRTYPLGILLWIMDRLALQSVLDWFWVPNRLDPVVVLVSRPAASQAGVCHSGGLSVHAASCLHELPGLIWFTPVMTLDHAILTAVWTLYIYAGSYFKDRRLLKFIGEPYYEYGKRIAGLPIIGFRSLRFFR
jgi:hypothetical protein